MEQLKTYILQVHGMHCNGCVALTESELITHPKVISVKSSLSTCSIKVCGDFGDMTLSEVAEELTSVLSQHRLSIEKQRQTINWKEFIIAVPIALGFVLLFVLLQKLGIINLVSASQVTYGTAFMIGVIASLSTCLAVVGGLLLSMSATFAREGDKLRPQLFFHFGRIISFFILGGVIGAVGLAFQLGSM